MSKTWAVIQIAEETPTDFYEGLCEAFQVYTSFDPEVPENQQMINTVFVTQSYSDIRRNFRNLKALLE
jgi:hypothetical protein